MLKTLDKSAVSYQLLLTKADQVKPAELESLHRRHHGRAGQTSRRLPRSSRDVRANRRRDAGTARRDGAAARRAPPMTGSRGFRILVILAAVMGADGVILAAASAHQSAASLLLPASSMLLFHALAVLAVVALSRARHHRATDRDRRGIGLCHRGRAVRRRPHHAPICRPQAVSVCRADRRHASDRELAGARGGGGVAAARGLKRRRTCFARRPPIG